MAWSQLLSFNPWALVALVALVLGFVLALVGIVRAGRGPSMTVRFRLLGLTIRRDATGDVHGQPSESRPSRQLGSKRAG